MRAAREEQRQEQLLHSFAQIYSGLSRSASDFAGVSLPVPSYPCNPAPVWALFDTAQCSGFAGTLLSKRYYTYTLRYVG